MSDPAASRPIEAQAPRPEPGGRAAPAESSAPQGGFARYEDYFNRNYYATYSYASPAYAPADWGTPAAQSAPQSAFTLPSIADLLDPAKLLPNVPLAVPSTGALPDLANACDDVRIGAVLADPTIDQQHAVPSVRDIRAGFRRLVHRIRCVLDHIVRHGGRVVRRSREHGHRDRRLHRRNDGFAAAQVMFCE